MMCHSIFHSSSSLTSLSLFFFSFLSSFLPLLFSFFSSSSSSSSSLSSSSSPSPFGITCLFIFDTTHLTAATCMALAIFSACLKVLECLYTSHIMLGWKPEWFASLPTFSSYPNCMNCVISVVWI
ncbi:uncharacterized protein BJ212DRAFT_1327069 [Suillus subaureus]|uniref:Uncharacterized protein n=1 Tax=Suillus subaureus TaxID=48587 RepID=A0A9P7EK37_9AGAM|nr:uncharacterized protein BJ212DRAFT_1327069 [Suillus subaureus]KAG1823910.1 hypothetical protein BJ212DRAFT_1327069 [Suillus subaureus]